MRLIRKLLHAHISPAQLAGFVAANLIGMAIVLSAFQLYRDVKPLYDQPDSFMKNDYLILSKKVESVQTAGRGNQTNFTAEDVAELESQPFVLSVGKFVPASYQITGSFGLGTMQMSTYLFFESVPDSFIDVQSDEWKFSPGDRTIPIIIPRNYLNLYNYGFARSQGLPQVPEEILSSLTIRINVSGNGRSENYTGRIAGFSNRLNTILVPENFVEWSNGAFGRGMMTEASRLIAEVTDVSDRRIHEFVTASGYEIEGDRQDSGKAAYFLRIITGAIITIGLIVTALSFFILMLSIFLLLQKNNEKLINLLLLGYTPSQVARPYQKLTVTLNLAVMAAAIIAAIIVRGIYIGHLSSLAPDYTGGGLAAMVIAGILIAVIVSAVNCLVIRHKILRLWIDKQ